ncbi:MAG: hypothetical protein AAF960_25310 [Bacteroidota bacterium]
MKLALFFLALLPLTTSEATLVGTLQNVEVLETEKNFTTIIGQFKSDSWSEAHLISIAGVQNTSLDGNIQVIECHGYGGGYIKLVIDTEAFQDAQKSTYKVFQKPFFIEKVPKRKLVEKIAQQRF